MPSENLVELHEPAAVRDLARPIDGFFDAHQRRGKVSRVLKVRLPAFPSSLGRAEQEHAILDERTSEGGARIPPAKMRNAGAGHIRGVQRVVAMEERR